MNRQIVLLSILLFSFLLSQEVLAQEKYEKESRIKPENVLGQALDFVDSIGVDKKIRWYSEVGIDSKSIEAKFKLNKKRYSVEFDTNGVIQDVEVTVKLKAIPSLVGDTISSELKSRCTRYKVSKVQIQYLGGRTKLLAFLRGESAEKGLTVNYELIVKCRSNKSTELYEYLFDKNGGLIKSSKLIFKNSSNLEY